MMARPPVVMERFGFISIASRHRLKKRFDRQSRKSAPSDSVCPKCSWTPMHRSRSEREPPRSIGIRQRVARSRRLGSSPCATAGSFGDPGGLSARVRLGGTPILFRASILFFRFFFLFLLANLRRSASSCSRFFNCSIAGIGSQTTFGLSSARPHLKQTSAFGLDDQFCSNPQYEQRALAR